MDLYALGVTAYFLALANLDYLMNTFFPGVRHLIDTTEHISPSSSWRL
jgi:hypothetical protein